MKTVKKYGRVWTAAAVLMLYFTSVVNQLLSFVLPLQFEKMDFRIAALGLQLSFFSAGALFSRVLLLNLIREENMKKFAAFGLGSVSYTHLRAHET